MLGKTFLCIDCSGEEEIQLLKFSCGAQVEVDCCPRCGGLWLESGELEDLLKLGKFYLDNLDLKAKTKRINYAPRQCPCCGIELKLMKQERFKEVELDVCPQCGGIWCEAGELKALAEMYF